jgi:hypothetical protein
MIQEFEGQHCEEFITIIIFEVMAATMAEFLIGLTQMGEAYCGVPRALALRCASPRISQYTIGAVE